MKTSTGFIVALYVIGALTNGAWIHNEYTKKCHKNIYTKTIVLMAGWPLLASMMVFPTPNIIQDGCPAGE